jgi:hypothetical protein
VEFVGKRVTVMFLIGDFFGFFLVVCEIQKFFVIFLWYAKSGNFWRFFGSIRIRVFSIKLISKEQDL